MSAAPTVIFRCDASATIGGGHVVRCMALADAFREAGATVRFAVSDTTLATVRDLEENFSGCLGGFAATATDVERLRAGYPNGVDLVVVDHYGIGAEIEAALMPWAENVLAIDDAPNRRHATTHLLDQTLDRRAEDYAPVVSGGTTVLTGSRYAMLRPAFAVHRSPAPPEPRTTGPWSVLVMVGMTDEFDINGMTAAALAPFRAEIAATFVLGSRAPHFAALEATVAAIPGWRLVTDAPAKEMAAITAAADFAIGAPGGASYERCCLGKPTLLVQVAENQAGNAVSLVAAGAAELLGQYPGIAAGTIGEAVQRLLGSPERMRSMARAAWSIADGQGARRVVAAVMGR